MMSKITITLTSDCGQSVDTTITAHSQTVTRDKLVRALNPLLVRLRNMTGSEVILSLAQQRAMDSLRENPQPRKLGRGSHLHPGTVASLASMGLITIRTDAQGTKWATTK